MTSPSTEETTAAETPPAADWEARALCSDESCIGVLGPDGRCKVCGRAGAKAAGAEAAGAETAGAVENNQDTPAEAAAEVAKVDDSDFAERELCPDDACIGVLDKGGRCNLCGAAKPGSFGGGKDDAKERPSQS